MKLIAKILLFALASNLLFTTANAFEKQQDLQTLFGDEIYICSADSSFDVSISDYEKLLHLSFDNNQHKKFQITDLDLVEPNIFAFNYQKPSSLIKLGLLSEGFKQVNFANPNAPRAPPLS